ncbi:unnamed protein product [Danaus chrysippus]|uniref:(African queen) hypothetical protein n=1 Tax=Danaus chrysippus TaxID=151541 RepID=A0A8J2QVW0_9NEOP|nr:unnamed protein product [Danaus chrysippus]
MNTRKKSNGFAIDLDIKQLASDMNSWVTLLIPYPSVQHFIWPLHWCLLADICNHTYIPECATDNEKDMYSRRLFIDECDLYEYNCDYETDYYPINYSDCFNIPAKPCPPQVSCPSIPTCPDHRTHTMGKISKTTKRLRRAFYAVATINALPARMLKGRRRYSPTWRKKKRKTTPPMTPAIITKKTIKKTIPTTTRTKIIKKFTIRKNGKIFLKVVKAVIRKNENKKKDSDFLE